MLTAAATADTCVMEFSGRMEAYHQYYVWNTSISNWEWVYNSPISDWPFALVPAVSSIVMDVTGVDQGTHLSWTGSTESLRVVTADFDREYDVWADFLASYDTATNDVAFNEYTAPDGGFMPGDLEPLIASWIPLCGAAEGVTWEDPYTQKTLSLGFTNDYNDEAAWYVADGVIRYDPSTGDPIDWDRDTYWFTGEIDYFGPIPEPATLTLLGLGLSGLVLRRFRRH